MYLDVYHKFLKMMNTSWRIQCNEDEICGTTKRSCNFKKSSPVTMLLGFLVGSIQGLGQSFLCKLSPKLQPFIWFMTKWAGAVLGPGNSFWAYVETLGLKIGMACPKGGKMSVTKPSPAASWKAQGPVAALYDHFQVAKIINICMDVYNSHPENFNMVLLLLFA